MITNKEVTRIAKLIKLRFSEEETADFAIGLTNIMNMIDTLNEVDCSNIEPLTSVCDATQLLRRDEVTGSNISDEIFANVPGSSADLAKQIKCFIVPKVVE